MKLNNYNHQDFLKQFNQFYDAVLRSIELRFAPSEMFGHATVTLSVPQSLPKRDKSGWVNVRIEVKKVEEFSLRESTKESARVLSSGLHIGPFDGLLFFDFAPYSVSPRSLEDYRRSGFYIAGRSFSWNVKEYTEKAANKKLK
jgi:hypothetical protein